MNILYYFLLFCLGCFAVATLAVTVIIACQQIKSVRETWVNVTQRDRVWVMARSISDISILMKNSKGVYGLHLNGANAPWNELLDGEYDAWLGSFHQAEKIANEIIYP